MSYNGYTNWETWNVVLWINNDEGLYNLFRGRKYHGEQGIDNLKADIVELAQAMGGTFGDCSMVDLMSVNWDELAESINDME